MSDYGKVSKLGAPNVEEISERTGLVHGVQAFAQKLIDDPKANAILARVGIGGEFTEDEHIYLHEDLALGRYFEDQNMLVQLDYQGIIQSLARRVVAGQFQTTSDTAAFEYVFARAFALRAVSYVLRTYDFRLTFEEFYAVLKDYSAWETRTGIFDKLCAEAHRREAMNSDGTNQDDINEEVFEPLQDENKRLMRKYGLVGNASVGYFHSIMKRDGREITDIGYLREQALRLKLYSKVKEV
jgi:hypothetical protein